MNQKGRVSLFSDRGERGYQQRLHPRLRPSLAFPEPFAFELDTADFL
ncbi:hypothetical protein [Streptomyces sp. NPDC001137]